jgi:hypothetical protein
MDNSNILDENIEETEGFLISNDAQKAIKSAAQTSKIYTLIMGVISVLAFAGLVATGLLRFFSGQEFFVIGIIVLSIVGPIVWAYIRLLQFGAAMEKGIDTQNNALVNQASRHIHAHFKILAYVFIIVMSVFAAIFLLNFLFRIVL